MLSITVLASAGKLISFRDVQTEEEQPSPHYFYSSAYWQKTTLLSVTGTFAYANCKGNDSFGVIFKAAISALHHAVSCNIIPDTGKKALTRNLPAFPRRLQRIFHLQVFPSKYLPSLSELTEMRGSIFIGTK